MKNLDKIIEQAKEGNVDAEQIRELVEGIRQSIPCMESIPHRKREQDDRCKLRISTVIGGGRPESAEDEDNNEKHEHSHGFGNVSKQEWPLELIKHMAETKGSIEFSKAGQIEEVRNDLQKFGIDLNENGTVKDNKKFIEVVEKLMEMKPLTLSKRVMEENGGNAVVKISIS